MIRRLTCPICEKELPFEIDGNSPLFPFCSRRCKLADLHRWFNGEYAVVEELSIETLVEIQPHPDEDLPWEEEG
jgi:uncharacterized protein